MRRKFAWAFSKVNSVVAAFALAVLATSAGSSQTNPTPEIFHHWPHNTASAMNDRLSLNHEIFHHWPHLGASIKTAAVSQKPDIFHHWPHLALVNDTENDVTSNIFHHWPHTI